MTALIRSFRMAGAADGPLAGETLAVKANIAIADHPWDGASPALEGVAAGAHASAVARALAAGGTIIGQANMHELAFGITSDNAHYGPVESPHGGMAGGSSGGTAAAVAGGLATMGLGTDTGGSGRIPAAFCGCVGLRPSTGRYPADGVLTLSTTLDTVSAMAGNVAGIARLDAVLADEPVALPGTLDGLRLGRLAAPFWADLDPQAASAAGRATARLEAAGARVERRAAPDLPAVIEAVALPIVLAEARRWWAPFLRARLGLGLADFAARIASPDVAEVFGAIAADETDDQALARLREGVESVRVLLADAMDGLDALIHPTVPLAAPPLHATEVEIAGVTRPLFPLLTGRALAAALAGSPAISLPIAGDDDRPLGLELLARPGADHALLGWAAAAERVL